MNRALRFACVMLAATLLVAGAMAQSVATADLYGTVKDPNGAVVNNATVTARDEARAFERSTKTDEDGNYQLRLLPPGHYTLTVEASGFGKLVAKDVGVTVGQQAEFSVTLKVAATATEVTVTGEAALVETQRTSSTTTIGQERIDNLPINGRNYINFTLTDSQTTRDTAPSIGVAPTSGLNFGGQRARSNLVNVDGADAVDNSVNGIRSTVSQEAVQEFQIITNSYAAEYGRASGGVVNIITRSGGNAFHGTAFGYLRNRDFQAVNPFSNVPNPAYTRVQAGFTLSGPIKKDRTFFFLSYETTRRQETGFSSIGRDNFGLVEFPPSSGIFLTPEQALFLGPILANPLNPLFPLANIYLGFAGRASGTALNGVWPAALGGLAQFPTSCAPPIVTICAGLPGSFVPMNSLTGNFPISEGTTVVALRLDHRFNNSQQGLLRVNVSPSTVTGLQPNTQNQVFGQNSFSRTAQQTFRDVSVTAQHTWSIGTNKINEFRFQYSRRGLLFTFARAGDSTGAFGDTNTLDDGSQVAVNIPGFAFFGREPFSFADRTEQRYQFTDNFSWVKGNHAIKFGADYNRIPIDADFTVNFGGLYDFGGLSASQVLGALNPAFALFPGFSPVQAYGLGVPQDFIQQVGDPHAQFTNNSLGVFLQDSWRIRPNLTLNYGVRYDVEFMPQFPALNALSQTAQDALNTTQTIPRDSNNVAPRIGIAWDPWKDGKTVFRASYGLFYDHPLLGLLFLSSVTDGTQAPGVILTPTSPAAGCTLSATNSFQGLLNACPASFGALPDEQRFDSSLPNSVFVNQNFLTAGVPLAFLSFGFPVDKRFEYAYSHQVNLTMEHDFGGNFALSVAYNFNGGRHLNHSIDVNPVNSEALIVNWERAIADTANSGATVNTDPRLVGTADPLLGFKPCGVVPAGSLAGQPWVLPALINFFRQSGLNPSLAAFGPLAPCLPVAAAVMAGFGLGVGPNGTSCDPFTPGSCVPVPFSFMNANRSNGSSVYHGLTVQLRKRFSHKYEFLGSYTWSHAIDDSTDLQSPLSPQDNRRTDLERSNSTFDQRHRFVFSGVYQSGKLGGDGFVNKFFSNWTVAPIIEVGSGRPFNILVGSDANFDAGSKTDRPSSVPAGSLTPTQCLPPAASQFSPTGFLQPACFNDGVIDGIASSPLIGNLGRNAGHRPYTVFTDFRVARRFDLTERLKLDGIVDMFNLINRFNVADVNLLYQGAGTPTSAFDPRQFQFALKLSF